MRVSFHRYKEYDSHICTLDCPVVPHKEEEVYIMIGSTNIGGIVRKVQYGIHSDEKGLYMTASIEIEIMEEE